MGWSTASPTTSRNRSTCPARRPTARRSTPSSADGSAARRESRQAVAADLADWDRTGSTRSTHVSCGVRWRLDEPRGSAQRSERARPQWCTAPPVQHGAIFPSGLRAARERVDGCHRTAVRCARRVLTVSGSLPDEMRARSRERSKAEGRRGRREGTPRRRGEEERGGGGGAARDGNTGERTPLGRTQGPRCPHNRDHRRLAAVALVLDSRALEGSSTSLRCQPWGPLMHS